MASVSERILSALNHEAQSLISSGLASPSELESTINSLSGSFKLPSPSHRQGKKQLFWLDIVHGGVRRIGTDGSGSTVLVKGRKDWPDGLQVDKKGGRIYWTCMGENPKERDGSIVSSTLAGEEITTVVPLGETFTPKQLYLTKDSQSLYWCDREGGRIQSCDVDGSNLRTLFDASPGAARPLEDGTKCCVGITVDEERGLLYWTQKGPSKGGKGTLKRMRLPGSGDLGLTREREVELMLEGLPEPIDLELSKDGSTLYWTDRGEIPLGNTLYRHSVTSPFSPSSSPTLSPSNLQDLIVASGFHEAIGLALDEEEGMAYVSDVGGTVWAVELESGRKKEVVKNDGHFTGIVLA